jgi:hypothetical protein
MAIEDALRSVNDSLIIKINNAQTNGKTNALETDIILSYFCVKFLLDGSLGSGSGTGGSAGGGAGNATAASIDSVTTNSVGATFTLLPAGACTELVLNNAALSAVDIEYQRGGAGASMIVPSGAIAVIEAITNSSGIGVRRVDRSDVQVTLVFERKSR